MFSPAAAQRHFILTSNPCIPEMGDKVAEEESKWEEGIYEEKQIRARLRRRVRLQMVCV